MAQQRGKCQSAQTQANKLLHDEKDVWLNRSRAGIVCNNGPAREILSSSIYLYIYLIRFGPDHSVLYIIRYIMRHNTIVSLHSNQFNIIRCPQSIVLFLMLVGSSNSSEEVLQQ